MRLVVPLNHGRKSYMRLIVPPNHGIESSMRLIVPHSPMVGRALCASLSLSYTPGRLCWVCTPSYTPGRLCWVCTPPYIHQGGYAGYVHHLIHTREAMLGMYHLIHTREAYREGIAQYIHQGGI